MRKSRQLLPGQEITAEEHKQLGIILFKIRNKLIYDFDNTHAKRALKAIDIARSEMEELMFNYHADKPIECGTAVYYSPDLANQEVKTC